MQEIVFIVLSNENVKYQYISDYLKLPYSTLSLYLKYLVDRGIIERQKIGYETVYRISDEERVAKVLVSYRSSILDKLVDKALSAWLETYSGKEEL